ncbi:MAG: hypothetical protein H0X24_11820 [Ktedonobacterales bacterium]|nr:hypothetical protein [Ktedonobacterales bacterium]
MWIVRTSLEFLVGLWDHEKKIGVVNGAVAVVCMFVVMSILNSIYFALGALLLVFAWNGAIVPLFHLSPWSFPLALSVLVCLAFAFWVIERVAASIRGK